MIVLGIETSCDETGVALYAGDDGLLAHALYSQVEVHAEYGGVVPELASRDHIRYLLPLISKVCRQAGVGHEQISAIAYTAGPGLVGALLVGISVARSLAWAWGIPAVAVNHMEGHLLAPLLEPESPGFPFVALLVSGGHTQLMSVIDIGNYTLLGESLDDAAGEAFDKAAKMMGLGYPGGPEIAKLAERGRADIYRFPRPMTDRPGLDFSFSGLKTFTLNTFERSDHSDQAKADIARAFEDAVADTLVIKCRRALEQTSLPRLIVSGGVSANRTIRKKLQVMANEMQIGLYFPRIEFSTDNGAMIAYAGFCRLQMGQRDDLILRAHPRWPLDQLGS